MGSEQLSYQSSSECSNRISFSMNKAGNVLLVIWLAVMPALLFTYADTEERSVAKGMCRTNQYVFCGAPKNVSHLPSSKKVLKNYCSKMRKYGTCLLDWAKKCKPGIVADQRMAVDLCTDTVLYRQVKKNIDCIYKDLEVHNRKNSSCRKLVKHHLLSDLKADKKDGWIKEMYPEISDDQYSTITELFKRFHDLGCFLFHLSCPEAEDLILEAFARKYSYLQDWLDDLKHYVFSMEPSLLYLDDQKKWFRESIEKYEKKCLDIDCEFYDTTD